jgi:tRNA pseudouridine55 synthase
MTGILLVDKPAGWTSMDVCAHLRGILHEKHVGHTGTLDPNATGLLVVLAGKATKAARFAESDIKEYAARLRLGTVTDTQDIWGTVLEQSAQNVTRQQLESVLAGFRGDILQLPPMYSAIKIRGQKLYQIARRGGDVARERRPITIEKLDVTGYEDGDWLLDIRCSKGTYVRALCADIGAALGCGGCMSALRRTAAGHFSISQAHTLEQIRANPEACLLPVSCITGEEV